MSHRGAVGCQGYSSNDHPIVMKLIDEWNKLGVLCGYIYSNDNRPMPDHLQKLNDEIKATREYFNTNPKGELY